MTTPDFGNETYFYDPYAFSYMDFYGSLSIPGSHFFSDILLPSAVCGRFYLSYI